ncbi:MAG: SDR family oxidoreductase [Paracoccaceae bacterium]
MIQGPHTATKPIITGGSQGLGYSIAEHLIAQGCRSLVIAARDPDRGLAARDELAQMGAHVSFIQTDLGKTEEVLSMVAKAREIMGEVNALVNAAATTDRGSILDTTPDEWDRFIAINTRGPFFAIQDVAQQAIRAGIEARIVNILTMSSHCGQSFLAGYSASKAALANITKNAANTLRAHKIRVNGINVGWMDTPGEDMIQRKWHDAEEGWLEKAEATQPFGSLVKPDHVAELVSYLLSAQSGVMTGSIIDFDQNVAGSFPE